jgi:hypothetical protein
MATNKAQKPARDATRGGGAGSKANSERDATRGQSAATRRNVERDATRGGGAGKAKPTGGRAARR